MEAGEPQRCDGGTKNCEGDAPGVAQLRGAKLCARCCVRLYSSVYGGERIIENDAHTAVRMQGKGFVPLKEDGEPITDWAAVRLEAKAAAAEYFCGSLLPTEQSPDDDKHPANTREEAERSYSNAYIVHMYAGIVQYCRIHGKKPRGEDAKPIVNASWTLYLKKCEEAAVRSLLPSHTPPPLIVRVREVTISC